MKRQIWHVIRDHVSTVVERCESMYGAADLVTGLGADVRPCPAPGAPAKTRQVEAHGIMKFDAGESMEPLGARDEFDT
mgnify:CR=1 FL=1